MHKTIMLLSILAGITIISIASCNYEDAKKGADDKAATPTNEEMVKRGEYLVSSIGCDDCHTPKKMGAMGPEPDMDKRFAGYPADRPFGKLDSNIIKNGMVVFSGDLLAAAGPWGVSFAANISGDETGLGGWTIDQFKKAMREGKWKGMDGTRPLLPPMPWQNFKNLTDDDLAAVFAFLKSTKPQKNVVPNPKQLSEL